MGKGERDGKEAVTSNFIAISLEDVELEQSPTERVKQIPVTNGNR